jgi:copper chaperone CopZ
VTTRTYDVPEISCNHCKASIEGALRGQPGVEAADVDIEAKTVRVDGSISERDVEDALGKIGYDIAGVR